MYDLIVIGGGAAGFYGAIQASLAQPRLQVAIFERGKTVLGKVKVSGGGRCNVTHAEFNPTVFSEHYPRGKQELLGPFHKHAAGDIMEFFETRGIPLKIEADGRIFPESDSSQSIIDCFLKEAQRLGIALLKNSPVRSIEASDVIKDGWRITTPNKYYHAQKLLIATGSNPKIWNLLEQMGHTIAPPVPSLFTFNCKDERIQGLQGLSTTVEIDVLPKLQYNSRIKIDLKSQEERAPLFSEAGPLLITHWGFSGPAVLRLSAWGAIELHALKYQFRIRVNWMPEYDYNTMLGYFMELKKVAAKRTIAKSKVLEMPNRLWVRFVKAAEIESHEKWADCTKSQLEALSSQITRSSFFVEGKSTFKEEFVTAGGVHLKEIDFTTFESKVLPNIYFAGEVINVDAITGGFNFQNAWTGAYLAAQAITTN